MVTATVRVDKAPKINACVTVETYPPCMTWRAYEWTGAAPGMHKRAEVERAIADHERRGEFIAIGALANGISYVYYPSVTIETVRKIDQQARMLRTLMRGGTLPKPSGGRIAEEAPRQPEPKSADFWKQRGFAVLDRRALIALIDERRGGTDMCAGEFDRRVLKRQKSYTSGLKNKSDVPYIRKTATEAAHLASVLGTTVDALLYREPVSIGADGMPEPVALGALGGEAA